MTPTARQIRFKAPQSALTVSECHPAPENAPQAVQLPCKMPRPARLPAEIDSGKWIWPLPEPRHPTHRALFPAAPLSRLPHSGPAVLTLP